MTLVLDTDAFAVSDREEIVRDAISSTIVPVEISWPAPLAAVAARGVISDLGQLTVCSIRSTANVVERTPRLARDDLEPSVFLGLQLAGSSLVVQGDREAVLTPGALMIYDSTAPYTLVDHGGVAQEFFRIPHSALALPHDVLRKLCAVSLSPGHPVAALTANYLARLAADPALFSYPSAAVLDHPSIELIRAVITTHLSDEPFGRNASQAALRVRVVEYLRAHLADPDLSAAKIAAAHYISVRYLYKLLAEQDISLANWIRHHRLEACRRELGRSDVAPSQVAVVARRWGFSDMSGFSRAFRAEYGLSPREWRDRRDRATDDPRQ
jgi:AraC-like DNA-binding protein